MSRCIDLTGQRFCRLTVVKRAGKNKYGNVIWLCKCDCGNELQVRGDSLLKQNTKSCGCIKIEMIVERTKTHGKTNTKLYKEWQNIKARCYNPKSKDYRNYGGRGIKVYDEWLKFELFEKFVSKLPNFQKERYTLNRIDNDGDYEPNNVEWANDKTQQNNKRSNHLITYNGKTQTLSQWAEEYRMKRSTLDQRINAYGWSVEKALITPVRKRKK